MPVTLSDGRTYDLSFERCAEQRHVLSPRSSLRASLPSVQRLIDVVVLDGCGLPPRFIGKNAFEWQAILLRSDDDAWSWFDWYSSQTERVGRELTNALRGPVMPPMQDLGSPIWGSALVERIRRRGPARATAGEWVRFILASGEHGVSKDETKHSGVIHRLAGAFQEADVLTRQQVASMVNLQAATPRVRLMVDESFRPSNDWIECAQPIKRTEYTKRNLLGRWPTSVYVVRYRHRSLGWSVVLARHHDLIQSERKWWLVLDAKGKSVHGQPIHGYSSARQALAQARVFLAGQFKKSARARHTPRWEHFSLHGLGTYAELLITLPEWVDSFYSPRHFPGVRNLLVHLRTNVCRTDDGRRVLFLDEVQSDWHGMLAKQSHVDRDAASSAPDAPFAREWPMLALKVALWWASQQGLDGVAWSSPELHQLRWEGWYPPSGVYRHDLPDAARKLSRVLQLELSRVLLLQRRVQPTEQHVKTWRVLGSNGLQPCGAFDTREQAERYADLIGATDTLAAPVLWLDSDRPIKRMPLFGVGDPAAWVEEPTQENKRDVPRHKTEAGSGRIRSDLALDG
ncbi:hypothetical protein [Aquabacterium sp.]|uniref:hypothetical protein n=1 Tax=Aquabacterium sp. TaxID=1872578 RepID=UPI0035B31825